MSDYEALVRAICQAPDDDTLRLMLADLIEEQGDPARAGFIRGQVQYERTPSWEPFAVTWNRDKNLSNGLPFLSTLTDFDGWNVRWAINPFRRGLGWRVEVRSLVVWDEIAEDLLTRQPIGELSILAPATRADWERFVAHPSLTHLRTLHFEMLSTPVDAIRLLSRTGNQSGINTLAFQRADSFAMPVLIEDLLQTSFGQQLEELSFRNVGHNSVDHLIDALAASKVSRLTLANAVGSPETIRRFCALQSLRNLTYLDLTQTPLGNEGVVELAGGLPANRLHSLTLRGVGVSSGGIEALARADAFAGLRELGLSRNQLTPKAMRMLSLSRSLAGLRSLDLSYCQIGDKGIRHLCRAKFWPNLVEIKLRGNPISGAGVRYLIDAPMPRDLCSVVLTGLALGGGVKSELMRKYGERLLMEGD